MRQRIALVFMALTCLCALSQAAISLTSPTTDWKPVVYSNAISDPPADNQANPSDLELVGDADNPAFYTKFDDAGPASATDGELGFRLRMSGTRGNPNKPKFKGHVFVGVDLDKSGSLDLFVAANDKSLEIRAAGTGDNTSPDTTSISKTTLWDTSTNNSNYSWTAVTTALDPTATSLDLDNEAGNDFFLTFILPFQALVDAANSLDTITGFDDTDTLSYIAATSANGNNLNSDINGLNGVPEDNTTTWNDLDTFSDESGVDGTPIPEPASMAILTGMAAMSLFLLRRWRESAKLKA